MSNPIRNIISLLDDCWYNPSFKDYIIKILMEFSSQNGVIIFKTIYGGSSNKIVAIKYPINIQLKGNIYTVKIIIYFVSEFPNKAPEVFIDNNNDPSLAVNPKNPHIIPQNFRVLTNKLFNWQKSTSIQEILSEIKNSFEINFPVYKTTPKTQPCRPIVLLKQSISNSYLDSSAQGSIESNKYKVLDSQNIEAQSLLKKGNSITDFDSSKINPASNKTYPDSDFRNFNKIEINPISVNRNLKKAYSRGVEKDTYSKMDSKKKCIAKYFSID